MSEKFTPGPWEFDGMEYIFKTPIGDGKMVAQIRGWGWLQKKGEDAGIAEQEANARLIAAAPDMYEALKELEESVEYWSDYDVPVGIVDKINAALAKADGTK